MVVVNNLKYVPTAVVVAVFGLIGGIIEALVVFLGFSSLGMGGAVGVIGAITTLIGGAIGGFVGGLIFAFLYNVLISRFAKLETA